MKCLSQQQIADYLQGDKSEAVELHFAECRDCRTALLKSYAEAAERFAVSPKLTEKTFASIEHESRLKEKADETVFKIRQFPERYFFALAAALLLVVSGIAYFIRMTHMPHATIALTNAPLSPSTEPAANKAMNSGSISQTMKVWRDTAKVKDIKDVRKNIIFRQENGTVIRLGNKTGIFAEPLTALHIVERTDTTILVELMRGNALFTIDKKRYRLFCVTTPHVRIRVTGTVFSVFVDSVRTKVNVLEGAVQVVPILKSNIEQTIEQGDEAVAQGDSVAAMEIMNRLTAKKRGLMLLDYLQSAVFGEGIQKTNDTSALPGPVK
jgi:hypothetical protein